MSLAFAGAVAPVVADECALADQLASGCRTAPAPDPEPQPQPAPQPQPEPEPEAEVGQQQAVSPGHQPAAVSRILALMNEERRSRNLPLFSVRADVSATSSKHSEAMAAGGTIWHNDAYFTAANKKRLDAALLGENVARNPEIDDAHRRLMNSPGHRANLLDRRFTVVGLAVYRSSTGSLYVTQNFVQPNARAAEAPRAAAPAAPKPATAKPASATPAPPAPAPVAEAAPAAPVAADVLAAAAAGPELFAAPAGLGGPAPAGQPIAALAALAVLALLGAAALVVRRQSVFAPLLSRKSR
ncbi:MAG TPA: CAP domain-containing protein [Acidimicrobiales bacterium]